MAGKGDIDIGINVKDEGVTAAVNAIFNGVVGAADNLNKILGIEVQKKLVVETFFDESTARKGIQVVERDVNNLGAQIEKLAEKSKKLEFGSATSLKGQIREATQARDQIKRYEDGVGLLGQKVRTVTSEWSAQNAKVQDLSRQLSVATASGFWGQVKAGFNLQGVANFSNGLVSVTQGLQSASILIGQVTASFNQLFTALAKIQQFELSFQAIGASASETSLAFQESQRIALGLGVGIQTVRDAFQQLSPVILASGGSIGDVSAITESLSSRFAAFGLNADKSRRVMNGVIQAFGKGKLMAEELTQQISEADPAFRVDLASAIGVTVAQLGDMVKAGEITSAKLIEFLPLLSKSSLLFGKLGDSGASAAAALSKGNVTITQAQTQLETLNQLSFEQLAGSLEPFLAALIRIQGAVVDFGAALSNSAALKAFGEFLGQVVNQAGAVIEAIGTIASVFFSIIEAVGNVITAIDNFTQSIGGVRVVVTALAALITAKLITSLFELGATAIGAVVRGVAALIAGVTTSGASFGGMAAAAGKAVLSFTGLNAATVKQIQANAGLVASTGGVTAALQATGAAATAAAGKILGAGGTNAAPWLADIAKQATTGAQGLGTLAPAVQQTIPAWVSAGGAAKAYTKGTFDAYAASVQAAGGVSKVAGAAQAGLPAFVPFTKALQGAQGAAAGLGPAAVFAAGGTAAAGVAAGAATAPTLTLAGAVGAARVAMAEAAKSAIAFTIALASNPIFLAVAAIALVAAGAVALNNTFGGSKASIDSFNAGMEGINKRTTEAKAAIDGAGDSATDFEERLGQLQTKADGLGAINISIKAANAKKEFETIEAGVKKAFNTAKQAVESYDAAADKSGKEGLKRAADIKAAEDAIALAIQSTKQKRAELEQAATQGGKSVTSAEKVILAAYNENVKSLEAQRDALRQLKSEASDKKIPITIEILDGTKAAIEGIEGQIKLIESSVSLSVDPEKVKQAYFDVEALKISLDRLKNNSYKIDADIRFKVDEAAFQNTLDLSKAVEERLKSAEALAKSISSIETAAVTARENSIKRDVDGLKDAESIRARGAQKELDYLKEIGGGKEAIASKERENDRAKEAAQNNIVNAENVLKRLAEEKKQIELRAAQARLDALPAIQAAERASLAAQQQITALKLDQLRLEQEQTKEALKRQRDELVNKEKNTKDGETKKNLNSQIGSLNASILNQEKLLKNTETRLGLEKQINTEQNRALSNTQQAQTNEAKAKVVELEGTVRIREVDVSSVDPVAVAAKVELENDPKLQKLVRDGKEANVKIVPQTKEATKKIDDFFKEVEKGPDPKLLKKWDDIFNTVSPEIVEAEIVSNIAPPDPGPAKEVVNDLSREGVEIASAITAPESGAVTTEVEKVRNQSAVIATQFEVPGSEAVLQKVQEVEGIDAKIQSSIDTPDGGGVSTKVQQLGAEVLQIPSSIVEPVVTAVDDIRKDLEGSPITVPVNVGEAQGGAAAINNPQGGSFEITPVVGEVDTTGVARKLERLDGLAPTITPVVGEVNTTEAARKLEGLSDLAPVITPTVGAPDTSEAEGVLRGLEGASPVVQPTLGRLDDSSLRGDLDALSKAGREIDSSLGPLDPSRLDQQLDSLKGGISIPASIQPRVENESEVEANLNRLARPIESTATYRIENEVELAGTLDEALRDRDINVGADTTEAEQAVTNLEEREGAINLSFGAPDDREVEQRISELEQRGVLVQTSLENLDTDEAYSKIGNLRNETVEIASSFKSPDLAPITAQIREVNKERVQIETGLDTPDSKDLLDEVKQIEGDGPQIPSNILDPSLTGIDDIRRELERNPIVIPVKIDSSKGASGVVGLEVAPTEIKPVVNTDEAQRKLRELGTPPPSVLPVVGIPETGKAQAAISELGGRPVEIETALKPLDDSSVRGQLKGIMQTDVTVFPELGVVDASGFYNIVNAIESRDVVVPARVDLNQDEVRALYTRAADEHPLDFEARVRGTDELDRVLERVEAEFPIEFRLETQRISTELNRLRDQRTMVQLGVEAEPGALERIDSQINALGEQKRAIDIKFLEPDPERVIEWVRTGLNVPLKLETIEVENELNRLQKRQADIRIGVVIPETGELQRIENELNGLLERRRVIQVAYSSPDPQAIENLGRELEAKDVKLKTSFQDLDLTEIDRQLDALRQRAVPITPTIRPVSTEATKDELSSLGATPVQFKPTVAPIPVEVAKAEIERLNREKVQIETGLGVPDDRDVQAKVQEVENGDVRISSSILNPNLSGIDETRKGLEGDPIVIPVKVGPVEGGDNLAGPEAKIIEIKTAADTTDASKKLEQLGTPPPSVSLVVTTPDTSEAQAAIDRVGETTVEIEPVLKSVDDSSVKGQLDDIRGSGVTINTRLGPLDESEGTRGLNALREQGIDVPARINANAEEAKATILRRIGEPEVLFQYRIKNEAEFDRAIARTDQLYTVEFRANAVEVERKLLELEERQRMIQLGVASEPGELEKINNEINKLEQQKRVIQVEYDKPDPMALQEWAKAGVNVPVKLETVEVENELRRLEERKRQIQLGVASEPGELQAVENQLRELEERRRVIQVAYNSPNPEAINQLGKQLEARNIQLKTSLQTPDPRQVDTELSRLKNTQVQFKSTVAPLPTETTKAAASALALTPIEFKPTVAPVPVKEATDKLSALGATRVVTTPIVNTPDTSKAQAAIDDLNRSSVRVTPVLESVDDAMVRSQLHALTASDVTFNTKLGPLDESEATRGINALRAQGIGLPVKLEAGENPADTILRRIGEPQILFEYRIKNEAEFDRLEASINKQYPIEFRANAAEVERKLFELEERQRMIQLGVVSEPGELERINSEISKLEQQRRIIQIEYEKPSALALQEWTRSGVNIPVKLETQVVENELQRLEERRRQILLGIDAGPGDLERVENQLRSLEARRTRIQVAYDSPNPEAINQLGRELEARNLRLKTSLQAPDPTPVNTQTAALAATPVVLRSTVAPLPTEATKAQAAALATTQIQLKPTVAPVPTEVTKAQAVALAATPVQFKPTVAPVPVEKTKTELSALGTTPVQFTPVVKPLDTTAAEAKLTSLGDPVNVPLTVFADTAQAKTAIGQLSTGSEAIGTSLGRATGAVASLGQQAQAAAIPVGSLATASANVGTSSRSISDNFAGVGLAATAAVTPINSLNSSLGGAATEATNTASSVGNIAQQGNTAATAFGQFLTQAGGVSNVMSTVSGSTVLLQQAFARISEVATTSGTASAGLSTNLGNAADSIQDSAIGIGVVGEGVGDASTEASSLTSSLSDSKSEANQLSTSASDVNTNIRNTTTSVGSLISALRTAASTAASIRIPSSAGKFAGGPVQGGASYTVNEFGKEMFMSSSGKLSEINAPAWGTWRAPSSGTIIPAHIAAGINIPKGGVKLSKPKTGSLSSSSKKGGNGLGRVVANLLNALNASQNARHGNSDAIQAGQALEIGKLSRAVDKLAKKDWNVNVAVRGSSGASYLDALNRSM